MKFSLPRLRNCIIVFMALFNGVQKTPVSGN